MTWVVRAGGFVYYGTIRYNIIYSDSKTLVVFINAQTQTQTRVFICSP